MDCWRKSERTTVYTGIPKRCANILANDLQFCLDPLMWFSAWKTFLRSDLHGAG